MADPVRVQIRNRIAELLTDATAAKSRVYATRLKPLDEDTHLPAIRIIMGDAEIERFTHGTPGTLQHSCDIRVQCLAGGEKDLADRLEVMAAAAAAALYRQNFAGLVHDLTLTGQEIAFPEAGGQPIGVLTLSFECVYLTPENDLTTTG